MPTTPYLVFDGQCKEALEFYERCLDGKIVAMSTFGDMPDAGDIPAEARDRILHAVLEVDGTQIFASDGPPGEYEAPQGFSICFGVDDPTKAEEAFHGLAEAGTVRMPIGPTFWAVRFGMLVDRFGVPWMVTCDRAP